MDSSLLGAILMCDARRVWRDDDCRDVIQWVSLRLGISQWKAQRWVDAAYALERLPVTSRALERGVLSLDVVELSRFATPEDEAGHRHNQPSGSGVASAPGRAPR